MLKRTITAVIAFALLLPILYLSHTWLFVAAVSAITVIAMNEIIRCIGQTKRIAETIPAYLIAAVLPALARLSQTKDNFIVVATGIFFLYMFSLLCLSMLSKRDYPLDEAAILFTMTFFIVMGFTSIVLLRDLPGGKYMYLSIFVACFTTDIFAYLTGRFFGKHKLCPEVSPKKTVEGAVGGTLFCIIAFLIFGLFLERWFGEQLNYLSLAFLGLVSACVSQFGDLIFSSIKRKYQIKDFGNVLPGHGGFLDRCDSMIAVSPFLYMICAIFEFVSPILS
ncbi:MAG: phosphatidate cytidylyltransferase [Ruminococcaceae bacterium]|nr:phosphatidate cytidylyltransferase [Oscillospiraceae bacterium]